MWNIVSSIASCKTQNNKMVSLTKTSNLEIVSQVTDIYIATALLVQFGSNSTGPTKD